MQVHNVLLVAALLAVPSTGLAQSVPLADASASSKAFFSMVSGWVNASVDKMPDAEFAFKPTPEVRSFAQLVGHIADAQFLICSRALGEKGPAGDAEKTKTTKADLKKALADGFAYCEQAHATLSGPKGAEIVDGFGAKHPRIGLLYFNTMHTFEHYGNVITYLRLKGIVPPSTEQQQRRTAPGQ